MGRVLGAVGKQFPAAAAVPQSEEQQTAAPSDAGISDSATFFTDTLCNRNSWKKIT